MTPWLVSAALFTLPIVFVALGDRVAHRSMSSGEVAILLALQGVGMFAGYGIAAWRKQATGTVAAPWGAVGALPTDAAVLANPASLDAMLDLAQDILEPHAVALYLDRQNDGIFELRGSRPSSLELKPRVQGSLGLIPAVRRKGALVSLEGAGCERDALGYYTSQVSVRQAVAAPVWLGSQMAGVLVVDSLRAQRFGGRQRRIIDRLGHQLGGALQLEEVLQAVSRDQAHKERFYQASRAFALARTVEQVARVAVDVARRITELDFAALVVRQDDPTAALRVAAAEWGAHVSGSAAIGHACPQDSVVGRVIASGKAESAEGPAAAMLLGPDAVPLGFAHVMPLNWKNAAVGALVVGHGSTAALSCEALDLVTVLADHAAVAIANALLFERLEHMATTDPLTGLANQRQFHELFDAHLARAERYGRQLSLIFTDIDHFKNVNDRYGHPMGDAVLRQVAQVLQSTARRSDLVARYGGEEFAILMEETDRQGARKMAERIRQAVEAQTLASEGGSVHCTMSLGVATFPKDAPDKARLIACADQALYQAKRSGRNQTVVFAGPTTRTEGSTGHG